MKEKRLIYHGEPCTIRLDDPSIQSFKDVRAQGLTPCPYYPDRRGCSPPRFGCIQLAGTKVARHVIQFYSEATEQTLALEVDRFQHEAPLPPEQVEGYIDTPDSSYQVITDPVLVVERVREYARAVLDLKPGERIFRSLEESCPPPEGVETESPREQRVRPAEVS